MPAADPRPTQAARLRRGLLPLLLACGLGSAAQAEQLKPFEVSYTVTTHGLTVAQVTLTLVQRDHETWAYSSHTEMRGFARLLAAAPPVQESVMRVTEAGVQPMSYREGSGTPATPKDIKLRFDWETGRVSGLYQSSQLDEQVPPGTQDELSIGIALVQEMVRGHTPDHFVLLDGTNSISGDADPGTVVTVKGNSVSRNLTVGADRKFAFLALTPGKYNLTQSKSGSPPLSKEVTISPAAHQYNYVREKEEVLSTKVGQVPTIVFRSTKPDGPRTTRYWLAPSYGFVPMHVEQKADDGSEYALVVQSIKR